ncbi:MAG TPA: hypothetical protein VEA63_07860, partial [Opitutus sp.]|nr:hypothetical protein [Opitutus sp.]
GPQSGLYQLRVNGEEIHVSDESRFDFHTAAFTLSRPVTVEVTLPVGANTPVVRPLRHKLYPTFHDGKATFTLSEPLNLVIQAEGLPPLALFATPAETDVPRPDDPKVLYFGPGIHEPGVIQPRSGQTIYLADGALVKGRIEATHVTGVRVRGRGVLDASAYSIRQDKTPGILFEKCADIRVEGIGLRGGSWWQVLFLLTEDAEVAHMNILGVSVNTDGIDIDGVRNFVARNCFIRCEDDGFGWHAVDAKRNGEPPTENCLAEDCVIWNTRYGNGLRVGASMETQLFRNITFRNIDVLEHAGAAIRSDHSDWALCENIRFENFIDESAGRVVEIVIARTRYSNDNGYRDERGRFRGLHFKNVHSAGGAIVLKGHDAEHAIDDVTFENCTIARRPLQSVGDIEVNEFVRNISFDAPWR